MVTGTLLPRWGSFSKVNQDVRMTPLDCVLLDSFRDSLDFLWTFILGFVDVFIMESPEFLSSDLTKIDSSVEALIRLL